jgi:hypothetical protein
MKAVHDDGDAEQIEETAPVSVQEAAPHEGLTRMVPGPLPLVSRSGVALSKNEDGEGSARTMSTATPLSTPSPSRLESEPDLSESGSQDGHARDLNIYIECAPSLPTGPISLDVAPDDAQWYTNGEKKYEPLMSPTGHVLYTDGELVFMLACVPIEEGQDASTIPNAVSAAFNVEDGPRVGVEGDASVNQEADDFSAACSGQSPAGGSTETKWISEANHTADPRGDVSFSRRTQRSKSTPLRRSKDVVAPDFQTIPEKDNGAYRRPRCGDPKTRPQKVKTVLAMQPKAMRTKLDSRSCQWPFGLKATVVLCVAFAIILLGRVANFGAEKRDELQALRAEQLELQRAVTLGEMKTIEGEMADLLNSGLDEPHRGNLKARTEDVKKLRQAFAVLSAAELQAVPKETYNSFIGQVKELLRISRATLSRRQQPPIEEDICEGGESPFYQEEYPECPVETERR